MSQVPQSIKKYRLESLIGQGGFGVIYKATSTKDKKTYAIKCVSRAYMEKVHGVQAFEQELRIHQALHHPNIIKILDVIYTEEYIFIVMDYCKNGDLVRYLESSTCIDVKGIFRQIVSAIEYLHARGVAHLDIKLENILLDDFHQPLLTDFGCAELVNFPSTSVSTTIQYAAPEVIMNYSVIDRRAADVWSLGIVLYTMVTRNLPWVSNTRESIIEEAKMGLRFHPNELSSAILNIVTKCCNMDPNRRPKAADLLNDSWLKQCPKIRQSANTIMNFKNHSCYSQCHAVNRIHSTGPIIIKNTFSVSGI